jgi:solute carrier family 10 (sodium/bile acid cotransporter), member 7
VRLLRKHWFNLALVLLLGIAYLVRAYDPGLGPVRPTHLSIGLVALIFFITGLLSPLQAFKAGVTNYRLHAFAQLFAFVFIPAATWGTLYLMGDMLVPELRQGILLLAILPTTITSCTIHTTMAGGNMTGAAFNAFLGNFIGVMLSPLLFLFLVAPDAGIEIDWGRLLLLVLIIIIPFALGMAARRSFGPLPPTFSQRLPVISASALLVIIFLAFQGAFAPDSPLWAWSTAELVRPLLLLLGLHVFFLLTAWLLSGSAGLPRPDRMAALFVGTQKTIALGLPMIYFFMADRPHLAGALAIPLLIYHPMQLIIGSFLAQRLSKTSKQGVP